MHHGRSTRRTLSGQTNDPPPETGATHASMSLTVSRSLTSSSWVA